MDDPERQQREARRCLVNSANEQGQDRERHSVLRDFRSCIRTVSTAFLDGMVRLRAHRRRGPVFARDTDQPRQCQIARPGLDLSNGRDRREDPPAGQTGSNTSNGRRHALSLDTARQGCSSRSADRKGTMEVPDRCRRKRTLGRFRQSRRFNVDRSLDTEGRTMSSANFCEHDRRANLRARLAHGKEMRRLRARRLSQSPTRTSQRSVRDRRVSADFSAGGGEGDDRHRLVNRRQQSHERGERRGSSI